MSRAATIRENLGPCPRCGKLAGELVNAGAGRFPFFVMCKACPFMTEHVRTAFLAVKLWNEEKPAPTGRRGGS